nr:immunoglobulin light chain junction region [Macaca mulatta]MOW33960.1 immunoglobulin light chain junction region [Macaca mulatta]MOW34009.1 immunoglobulin light chain junction region [Macaca mulatta]MOW34179.1 immunoglobulin light chain junction region [Macaca mulatta]MOW34188.1 immunoglobulin light chain junction region [Macaca mulatta]
CLQHDDYPRTF